MRSARPMRSNRAPGAPIRHAADMLITAGMHHDGQGYNLLLQAMPLDGKLVPRVYRVVEGPRHQLDRRVRAHRPMRSSSARAKLDSASWTRLVDGCTEVWRQWLALPTTLRILDTRRQTRAAAARRHLPSRIRGVK